MSRHELLPITMVDVVIHETEVSMTVVYGIPHGATKEELVASVVMQAMGVAVEADAPVFINTEDV